ncbi:hypothetical protein CCP2SC5_590014 [Azospirillaceae bacterium]
MGTVFFSYSGGAFGCDTTIIASDWRLQIIKGSSWAPGEGGPEVKRPVRRRERQGEAFFLLVYYARAEKTQDRLAALESHNHSKEKLHHPTSHEIYCRTLTLGHAHGDRSITARKRWTKNLDCRLILTFAMS